MSRDLITLLCCQRLGVGSRCKEGQEDRDNLDTSINCFRFLPLPNTEFHIIIMVVVFWGGLLHYFDWFLGVLGVFFVLLCRCRLWSSMIGNSWRGLVLGRLVFGLVFFFFCVAKENSFERPYAFLLEIGFLLFLLLLILYRNLRVFYYYYFVLFGIFCRLGRVLLIDRLCLLGRECFVLGRGFFGFVWICIWIRRGFEGRFLRVLALKGYNCLNLGFFLPFQCGIEYLFPSQRGFHPKNIIYSIKENLFF